MGKYTGHALCRINSEMRNVKRPLLTSLTFTFGLLVVSVAHAECQIQLSEAKIAYAPVTRGELLSYSGNTLTSSELRIGDARNIDIMVSCDRPATIALAFNGAAKDSDNYRFGADGRATLMLHDVFIDNQPVTIDSAGQRGIEMAFTPGNTLRFWLNNTLAVGTMLRGKISITAWQPSKTTRINENKTWELHGAFVASGIVD